MKRLRHMFSFAFAVLILAASGCAYFNTFYLAKHHFNEAERLRSQKNGVVDATIEREYGYAIDWASEILRTYSDSRYVDDSLFIIGMSNFYQQEYTQARTKFEEILRYFPDSELALNARYYQAQSLIELGDTDEALLILVDLENTGDKRLRGMAGISIARIHESQEDWESLADAAQEVIDADVEREQRLEGIYLKGVALRHLGDSGEAITVLADLAEERLPTDLRFEANSLLALVKADIGRYDEAMSDLVVMQNRGEFSRYAPRIRLEIGTVHELRGDTGEAIATYTNLAGDYPDSLAAKEAWYKVGTLLLTDMANAREAREAFNKVKQGRANTSETWYADAQIKSVQIDSLLSKRALVDALDRRVRGLPPAETEPTDSAFAADMQPGQTDRTGPPETSADTLRVPLITAGADLLEQLAAARFSLAEVYTYSFDRPDSALTQYRLIIDEAPGSEYAIKSRFFLESNNLRRTDGDTPARERELMERLIAEYPESEFAQELKVQLGLIENTPDSELFNKAEQARLGGESPDVFIPLYQAVVDQYPRTGNAYRARINIAYAREHFMGDLDGAVAMYRALADEEATPNSREFVEFARGRLDMLDREEAMLADIASDIEYYEMVIRDLHAGTSTVSGAGSGIASGGTGQPVDAGYLGMRKIRARNARIRSRYYTD